MRICVLGSGSTGNSTYVGAGDTHVLVDAGLTYRDTISDLAVLGVDPGSLAGILLTHDHEDHTLSAGALRRRHSVRLYANECTASVVDRDDDAEWNIFENGSAFEIGMLKVEAFQVPHDGADPVGFVIASEGVRLGIVTDLGMVTPLIKSKLQECDALIMETNYDPEMLCQSKRHESVKRRALGRSGHLSNEAACELLAAVLNPRLRAVFMVHLSTECNTPFLAEQALRDELKKAGRQDVYLVYTHPRTMSKVIEISSALLTVVT